MSEETTHFGFEDVPAGEKQAGSGRSSSRWPGATTS